MVIILLIWQNCCVRRSY